MISTYIKALTLIFLAEMGDKTQLMAMSFATKYKVRNILIGIGIGAFLNHGLAILLGSFLQKVIPFDIIYLVAGFVFILFGLLSLQIDEEALEEKKTSHGPIIAVSIAFFIGELGDKTQLTALALSTSQPFPLIILLGTVSGMVLTGLLGIWVGIKLGSKVPELQLKIGAASIFMFFGVEKIIASTYFGQYTSYFMMAIALSVVLFTVRTRRFICLFKEKDTLYSEMAERLHHHFKTLKVGVDKLCLGEDHCQGCDGSKCLVGSLKILIELAISHEYDAAAIKKFQVEDQLIKKYDKHQIKQMIRYIDTELMSDHEVAENLFIIEIRKLLVKADEALN